MQSPTLEAIGAVDLELATSGANPIGGWAMVTEWVSAGLLEAMLTAVSLSLSEEWGPAWLVSSAFLACSVTTTFLVVGSAQHQQSQLAQDAEMEP